MSTVLTFPIWSSSGSFHHTAKHTQSPVISHCNKTWALADCFQIWLFDKDTDDSLRTLGGFQDTGFFVFFFFSLVCDSGYFFMALYTMFIHIRTLLFFYHCLPRKIPSLRFSSNITIIFSLRLNSLFYTRNRGMDFRTSLIHSLVLYPWVSGLNSLSLSLFVCEVGIITPASLWAILKLNSWTRPFRTNT